MSERAIDVAERAAASLQQRIQSGLYPPGTGLHEQALAAELGISRNSLREAFRVLMHDGLVARERNRGVFVLRPSFADVLDNYRARRLIEVPALRSAPHAHPAIARMREAVAEATTHRDAGRWRDVGTANSRFHTAVVALADSPRLDAFAARLLAQVRLAFLTLPDPEHLHAPFVVANAEITTLAESGSFEAAADALSTYFDRAERMLIAAYSSRGEH